MSCIPQSMTSLSVFVIPIIEASNGKNAPEKADTCGCFSSLPTFFMRRVILSGRLVSWYPAERERRRLYKIQSIVNSTGEPVVLRYGLISERIWFKSNLFSPALQDETVKKEQVIRSLEDLNQVCYSEIRTPFSMKFR